MDGDPLSPGQVLVVDGKIKAVGSKLDLGDSSPKVVELGENSVLIPGLIDAYTQTGLGKDGSDESTDEITPDFRAIDSVEWDQPAVRRQLEQGTTTMCVCPGTQNVVSGISAIIKTIDSAVLNEDGPLLASMCSDPASQNQARRRPDSIFVRQPTNRMGVVWILRNTFSKAKRDSDSDSLTAIKQVLAGDRPLMVVSRVSHDLTTVATLADEFGFAPILVGGQEAYKVKDMISERKYPVILQPQRTGAITGPERSELCWNQAGVLAEAGITFALSGDDLLEQARFAHRNGLDKNLALSAITSTPAKLLGIEKQVGTIAVGKDADLIALTGEPLEFTTSILWVMANGQAIEMDKEK
jgi:imidazolonepropionase-like amidohydrolase